MEIHGVYLIDFGINIGNEFNGKHYGIIISSKSHKDETMLVVPITSKKAKVKYRGGFTIDNNKYQKNPSCSFSFAKVRKIKEIDKKRIITKKLIYKLDEIDVNKLKTSLKDVIVSLNQC
ncbi:MAG: type II toxin-antitoxin system PemK/MazF family toxin [Fusobacteriaceae bacterium]